MFILPLSGSDFTQGHFIQGVMHESKFIHGRRKNIFDIVGISHFRGASGVKLLNNPCQAGIAWRKAPWVQDGTLYKLLKHWGTLLSCIGCNIYSGRNTIVILKTIHPQINLRQSVRIVFKKKQQKKTKKKTILPGWFTHLLRPEWNTKSV